MSATGTHLTIAVSEFVVGSPDVLRAVDDGELRTDFVVAGVVDNVAGVVDNVARVGVDAGDARDRWPWAPELDEHIMRRHRRTAESLATHGIEDGCTRWAATRVATSVR